MPKDIYKKHSPCFNPVFFHQCPSAKTHPIFCRKTGEYYRYVIPVAVSDKRTGGKWALVFCAGTPRLPAKFKTDPHTGGLTFRWSGIPPTHPPSQNIKERREKKNSFFHIKMSSLSLKNNHVQRTQSVKMPEPSCS